MTICDVPGPAGSWGSKKAHHFLRIVQEALELVRKSRRTGVAVRPRKQVYTNGIYTAAYIYNSTHDATYVQELGPESTAYIYTIYQLVS